MSARRRAAWLGVLLAGCAVPRPVEPDVRGREVVVVNALLSTETGTQTIWIERSLPIDSPPSLDPRPLVTPPSLVEVRDTLGTVVVFTQDPARPSRYVASFTPIHGRRYDLRIDVDTLTLGAFTTVPLPLILIQPATDTVQVAMFDSVRVAWTSASTHFGWAVTPTDSARWSQPSFQFNTLVRDSALTVPGFEFEGMRLLWILAFDPVSWAYFHPRPRLEDTPVGGNVTGGAGLFGAVTGDRVVVRRL